MLQYLQALYKRLGLLCFATKMPRRSDHHRHRELVDVNGGCDECAALTSQCDALRRRVEMLERQLRATGNLHALLAANDRQLALCRARLERQQLGASSTAAQCEPDVEKRGDRACTSAQERPSKRAVRAVLSV